MEKVVEQSGGNILENNVHFSGDEIKHVDSDVFMTRWCSVFGPKMTSSHYRSARRQSDSVTSPSIRKCRETYMFHSARNYYISIALSTLSRIVCLFVRGCKNLREHQQENFGCYCLDL